MFTKFKAWLTGVVATEVAKVETSLTGERTAFFTLVRGIEHSTAQRLEQTAQKLEARSEELFKAFEQRLVEEASKVVAEKNLLIAEKNQIITELHTKVADLQHVARKVTHWTADSVTAEADHSLRVVK